jgi:hypothetical protein
MKDYGSFEPERVKHLEMLQAVIARLGNDSFLVKGWSVTVAGAFLGFAVSGHQWKLALASIVPTLAFWGLDTYYLRSERLFRLLFDQVRRGTDAIEPFFMAATASPFVADLPRPNREVASWWKTARRPTLSVFYGALLASAALVVVLIRVP